MCVSLLLARLFAWDPLAFARRTAHRLTRVPSPAFALLCAGVALVASGMVAWKVLGLSPSVVDEMVELLHARVLASGRLALPLPGEPAAWIIQNSLLAESGAWASVYPPFHTGLLALGLLAGTPWIVGPLSTGAMAGFGFLSLTQLFPDRPALTRMIGLLVALSPFTIFLGGSFLSHTTAGALAAMVLWTALKAREGGPEWNVATGACVGAFVCTRPWTGVVLSTLMVAAVWLPAWRSAAGVRGWLVARVAGLVAGGFPFAVLLLGWNELLFGAPLRLGYAAAFGPAHGLGFHLDPWANAYGPLEALAYTGADLVQLGTHLLEGPLSALVMVGLGLATLRVVPKGTGPLVAWAFGGVVANALYWHHGIHMGPRFLFETGPAWVALWGLVVVGLSGDESPLPSLARRTVGWAALLSLVAGLFLVPARAESYRPDATSRAASVLPTPPQPALVFVHGSWSSRVAARLAAAGMRRDSVEIALRRNDLCAVDGYARWRGAPVGPAPAPALDLRPLSGPAPGLELRTLSPGNRAWFRPGGEVNAVCQAEARSDRGGTVELEPLVWQAPPLPDGRVIVARDLGPLANDQVRAAFPGHGSWVAVDGGEGAPARLLGYDEGMIHLWGEPESGATPQR